MWMGCHSAPGSAQHCTALLNSLRLWALTCPVLLPFRTGPQASSDATAVCATKNDGSCFSAAFSDALAKCEASCPMYVLSAEQPP